MVEIEKLPGAIKLFAQGMVGDRFRDLYYSQQLPPEGTLGFERIQELWQQAEKDVEQVPETEIKRQYYESPDWPPQRAQSS